jgi:hypothetical protein
MGDETRELTHRYSAELRGMPPDERLVLRRAPPRHVEKRTPTGLCLPLPAFGHVGLLLSCSMTLGARRRSG